MNSNSSVTSFRKKGTNVINIPGTRVSFQNAQLLTSTGSPTLDFFIGGGLAVGTLCLIEEDRYNSYSSLFMKYFLAEGVIRGHSIFLASGEKDPEIFLKELPAAKSVELSSNLKSTDGDEMGDSLKIAWRYKNKTMENTRNECHNIGYDLSKIMPEDMLQKCHRTTWDPLNYSFNEESTTFLKMPYISLFKNIKKEIVSKGFKTSSKATKNVLRIGINSIPSPLWQNSTSQSDHLNLIRFLYTLKALLRTSFAVAIITVPSFIFSDTVLVDRMRQICDTVLGLESFVGSDKKSNPLFKDFDGLLHIRKLPVLNTLVYPSLTTDLAFKLKRKGLLIERLHLPPEIEDPSPEQQGQFSCSGGLGRKLDF